MTLFDGPRDVTDHLKELESRLNSTGYDHQGREMTGWRAERQLERIRESEIENQSSERQVAVWAWLLEKLSISMPAASRANLANSGQ